MPDVFLSHATEMRERYYGEEALGGLEALARVRLNQAGRPLATGELIAAAAGCAVIVSDRMTEAPAALFRGLPDLVAFVRCAVDIRNVDVDAASAAGVLVTRASAGFVDAVAELTLGFMVDLARGITASSMAYRAGRAPAARTGRQLAGACLGVIGYGAIGRRLAALGQALGMAVLVSDPHVRVERAGLEQVDLNELLARADFVVCLAVANEATENLMDEAAFAAMRSDAFFINVSRGNLVDEAALERALDRGAIAGAAMDVGRAPDQMPSPHLAARPDVLATPHAGGLTPQAVAHQALESVAQVAEILRGRAPSGAVNVDAASRLARLAGKPERSA